MTAKHREEMFDLIPAYALGALDDSERAEFEAWLQQNPEALATLAEYQAAAGHLVTLAPLRPAPEHLQADLRRRLAASPRGDVTFAPGETALEARRTFRRRRGWWILAAAALFIVVIVGAVVIGLRSREPEAADPAQLYAQLAAQPGASQVAVVPGEVDEAVSGDLVIASDGERAVLRVAYLPPIASDQTFQMWLIDADGARTSAGLFQADTSENALYIQVPFDGPVTAYKGVGVSLEPAGGSPYQDKPTGPRVLSVPLG